MCQFGRQSIDFNLNSILLLFLLLQTPAHKFHHILYRRPLNTLTGLFLTQLRILRYCLINFTHTVEPFRKKEKFSPILGRRGQKKCLQITIKPSLYGKGVSNLTHLMHPPVRFGWHGDQSFLGQSKRRRIITFHQTLQFR